MKVAGAFLVCVAFFLGSCAPRQIAGLSEPIPEATQQRIFVATQRTPDQIHGLFGAKRTLPMNYGLVDVSIPPNHRVGHIEWPNGDADLSREFGIVNVEPFRDVQEFQSRVANAKAEDREVTLLYVHGFNNTISEATFRLAQIMADFETDDPAVMFGWPSAADPRAYVYDRDSALFARDDLVQLLSDITVKTDRNVAILAHSMGAHLIMEALRQIAISGDEELLSKVVWMALISPDSDPDVFRRQAQQIGTLPEEFYILIARQDRALKWASFLTGGRRRVGAIDSVNDLAGLDVTVFDLSKLADGRRRDHGVGFNSPAAIQALKSIPQDVAWPQDGAPELIVFGND